MNISKYKIIAVGKIRKNWIKDGLSLYLKRLPRLTITELRDSTQKKEAEAIRNMLTSNETTIALTEEGEALTSVAFSQRLESLGSSRLTFIIGGADGLPPEIKELSSWQLSLSSMTLPHELARLLLVEQLYRAYSILQKTPYHRA